MTGLVDYAGVGIDTVATDLARLFGSLVDDDEEAWQTALAAYRRVRRTGAGGGGAGKATRSPGVIAGLVNWARWLAEAHRTAEAVEHAGTD
ncbi:MAG: hypothetical protein U0736_08475 [Gemmataceae bacterium]